MRIHIKILFILLVFSSFVSSQSQTKTDTIGWSNYQIIIEIPTASISHYDSYEEGFFRTISCFLDSAVITIHCGAMMNLPLIDLTKYTVTSKFILDKDIRVLRGYGDSLSDEFKGRRCFREENYLKYGITVMYENVSEQKLTFYDDILNNIKIINTEMKH